VNSSRRDYSKDSLSLQYIMYSIEPDIPFSDNRNGCWWMIKSWEPSIYQAQTSSDSKELLKAKKSAYTRLLTPWKARHVPLTASNYLAPDLGPGGISSCTRTLSSTPRGPTPIYHRLFGIYTEELWFTALAQLEDVLR
jgi:hypothetical protein